MSENPSRSILRRPTLFALCAGWVALSGINDAQAQYKYVGPDGRVTYSDRPPPPDLKVADTTLMTRSGVQRGAESGADLPYATKIAANKYPVTVYVSPDCGPCAQLKAHLQRRGVPFSEKVLRNTNDLAAFKAAGFSDMGLPGISIGNTKRNGYEAGALDTLLDAAAYPKQAVLPPTYQAKSEPLTAEPVAKATINVAEGAKPAESKSAEAKSAEQKAAEAKARREKLQPKPEPLIRF